MSKTGPRVDFGELSYRNLGYNSHPKPVIDSKLFVNYTHVDYAYHMVRRIVFFSFRDRYDYTNFVINNIKELTNDYRFNTHVLKRVLNKVQQRNPDKYTGKLWGDFSVVGLTYPNGKGIVIRVTERFNSELGKFEYGAQTDEFRITKQDTPKAALRLLEVEVFNKADFYRKFASEIFRNNHV